MGQLETLLEVLFLESLLYVDLSLDMFKVGQDQYVLVGMRLVTNIEPLM